MATYMSSGSSGSIRTLAEDARYRVKLADTPAERESALRLRFDVFNREMRGQSDRPDGLEFDHHDRDCSHLIVVEKASGETVGTYRMKSIESAIDATGFYSHTEFAIESLPREVLQGGVEIGRACIAPEHRNTKALFLLWKALATHLTDTGKRYLFGCCSIFTDHPAFDGERAFRKLVAEDRIHEAFGVEPRNGDLGATDVDAPEGIKLPDLFEMYLRIGARVCGRPTFDADFGTVDFFVVFDLEAMEPRYRKLFFGAPRQTKTFSSNVIPPSLSNRTKVELRVP